MLKPILVIAIAAAVALGGVRLLRADPVASKAKWEYKVVDASPPAMDRVATKQLNDLAADGWEFDGSIPPAYCVFRKAK